MSRVEDSVYQPKEISDKAYQLIKKFIYVEAGIDLGPSRHMLVSSRLGRRLLHHKIDSYDVYTNKIVNSSPDDIERQMAIDLLTTNETFFFREAIHFEKLKTQVLERRPKDQLVRVWSAASSSGEEAYSIAMVLDDFLDGRIGWEVFGSDISRRVIASAKNGLYPMNRIEAIPADYLKRYCLKGTGKYQGYLLIDAKIRERTRFAQVNLNKSLPDLGLFDAIFLRNVLIYFDYQTQEKITRNLLAKLRPGGILFIGHAESLKGLDLPLRPIAPTTYQKI